jgi:hypothetical protein
MKKLTIVAALGLAAALAVGAGAAETKAAAHKTGGAMKSLTGCLEKGDETNTFKLTHASGEGDWELVGAPAALKMSDHVGHKVEVSGRALSAAAAENAEHKAGEKKESKAEEKKEMKDEKGEHHLKMASLKHVAPTCP